jgi:hypothetical protein
MRERRMAFNDLTGARRSSHMKHNVYYVKSLFQLR